MGSGFRSFAFGEVLTSANVQNYLMDQAVTVFAGTAARGSAITSPETGMVSYRTDGTADSKREGFEFYDGSAWTRMIPAAVSSGLVLISTTTIGSAVSSVTVSNAFSSTYDRYLITVTGGAASTGNRLRLTLGATSTGYYAGSTYNLFASASTTAENLNNAAYWTAGAGSTNGLNAQIFLDGPNAARRTGFRFDFVQMDTTSEAQQGGGFLNDSTSYTAFTFTANAGTWTGGTIRVYGLANS